MKRLMLAAMLVPMSAAAQVAAPPAIVVGAPDPTRVVVARKLMDQIMPPATRDQMMRSMMGAFFSTPTGQAYITQSPTVMADPDVGGWMNQLMTRSMQRLPAQMATLKAEIEALDKKKKAGS